MRKHLACCPRNSASSSKRETTRITYPTCMTARNLSILILTNILALDMVNRVILKLNVLTKSGKTSRSMRRKENQEEFTMVCLMIRQESDASSVSSNSSINSENYSQLLNDFKETHEEANKLALSNNRLREFNNWLEKRVKVLEEELEISKNDFENLNQSYKRSSCKNDSNDCENCESLEKKIHYLVKTVDKLSKGKLNFETFLASQSCVFGKSGLGFNPHNKKSGVSKPYSTVRKFQLVEKSKQPVVTCFYCMKRGHSVRYYKIRKFFVPKGVMKWIPKNPKASTDPINDHGPKFVRGPNLVA